MSRLNLNKWFKKCKGKKTTKVKSVGLRGCPQKRGVCLKVFVCSPKKPNSARRKVVKVRLSNKVKLTAYIPGQVHRLQEHSQVLVRGGRVPDLPGVKYRLIRNKLDLEGLSGRKTSRSKYGTKKIGSRTLVKKDKNNLINSDKIKSDPLVTKMISLLMRHGKRSKAEKVLSKTFLFLDKDYPGQSIDIFYTAIINARQDIAVRLKPKSKKKTRRNKHSYDVYIPRVILPICGINLGIRSILKASRERSKFSFLPLWESLSQELFEASQNKGKVIENRFKVNSLAVSNKGKVRFSIRG